MSGSENHRQLCILLVDPRQFYLSKALSQEAAAVIVAVMLCYFDWLDFRSIHYLASHSGYFDCFLIFEVLMHVLHAFFRGSIRGYRGRCRFC